MKINLGAINYSSGFTPDQLYLLKSEIGQGAEAIVYDGIEIGTGKNFAVKVFHRTHTKTSFSSNVDIVRHPNVVLTHFISSQGPVKYIVMERCDKDLYTAIQETNFIGFTEIDTWKLFYKIVKGLSACHNKGIYHGDIKPANILLANDVPKLCDFLPFTEISKGNICNDSCNTTSHHDLPQGTDEYLPPEAFPENKHRYCSYPTSVSAGSRDVWALGITLFNMITGESPWGRAVDSDPSYCHFIHQPSNFWSPKISPHVRSLLQRMLEPDLKKRISLSELLHHSWCANQRHILHNQNFDIFIESSKFSSHPAYLHKTVRFHIHIHRREDFIKKYLSNHNSLHSGKVTISRKCMKKSRKRNICQYLGSLSSFPIKKKQKVDI